MPIVSSLTMNVWWSWCGCGQVNVMSGKPSVKFIHLQILMHLWVYRLYGHLLPWLPVCLSTLDCIIMTIQMHENCRLLSIVCHGKRFNSFYLLQIELHPLPSQQQKPKKRKIMEERKPLTAATSSYERITKQVVFIVCRYNVYRIFQPTNSLFRKPYNEINSDKIYGVNATENRWQCDDCGNGTKTKGENERWKARMKKRATETGGASAKIKTSCSYCVGFLR